MKNKNEVQHIIPTFHKPVFIQFNTRIKAIGSDNALELKVTPFLIENGIIHQLSCVEMPQQNSIVERKHQHILNVARSLLIQASMPEPFWGDAVLTVVHLINKTPSKVLTFKTPLEILFGKQPKYHHLRVFGCLAFASTLKRGRTKFDSKAKRCVFIGYSSGMKAYKLYGLATHEVLYLRDVVLYEHLFPFHKNFSKSLNAPDQCYSLPCIPEPSCHDISFDYIPSQHNQINEACDTNSLHNTQHHVNSDHEYMNNHQTSVDIQPTSAGCCDIQPTPTEARKQVGLEEFQSIWKSIIIISKSQTNQALNTL